YNFFITYANLDGWEATSPRHSGEEQSDDSRIKDLRDSGQARMTTENVLDEWILALLHNLVIDVTTSLDRYDTVVAIEAIKSFVTDFSTWYIRRSRDRVGSSSDDAEDKNAFYTTTYHVLTTLTKLMAPLAPFLSESIYTNLTGEESVHLAEWPIQNGEPRTDLPAGKAGNGELLHDMILVRKIVEIALSQRKNAQKKVRHPLASLSISVENPLSPKLHQLIKDEVNVLELNEKKGMFAVELDTETMTPELEALGQARDIVRKIQEERKKLGTRLDEKVSVNFEYWQKQQ
ncbi:class I tRNA ligase family protein, partial [Candidatus Microgenomates bacterium]|nr:class I tRNA ligase family protein [Candidatus Microgenomates bacterium]